jgi:phenylalanyl-tRNA synthetase beta chain
MGWKTGKPEYKMQEGTMLLNVDESVQKVRPYILGAVIRNIQFDHDAIREIMEMQEDIHWGVGRNRRKASIGVHNLNNVSPPFRYYAADPDKVKFIPLDSRKEMTLREILQKHEKGRTYKHLVDWAPKYPLLIDARKNVLSMPPIINGELTRLTQASKNLLLDVTGPNFNAITQALNVLVTSLADAGGTIESIQVNYPDRTVISPDLTPQRMTLRSSYPNQLLGLKLSQNKIIECLQKARLHATKTTNGNIDVEIPPYRIDILHEVDLVEDVALGYGYYKLKPTKTKSVTTGSLHEATVLANAVRQIMIGLGFSEVTNFIITNEAVEYTKMRRPTRKTIKIANPISFDFNIARSTLLPSLMKNLMENKHKSFPQQLFEVSDIVAIDKNTECRCQRSLNVAGVSSHSTANFTEIKAVVEALLSNLDVNDYTIRTSDHPSFISGRVAWMSIHDNRRGVLGEIHPEVLNNFELENPVSAFEVEVEHVFSKT